MQLPKLEFPKIKLKELLYIVYRNVFLFTNGIILVVVILLFAFGDVRSGLFLGIVSIINIFLGLAQDIYAWIQLEKLQLLTAPHVVRLNGDQTEEPVLIDQIKKGDLIKLKIGDQIPCDSKLMKAQSFEINEGLITGESSSISKREGDNLLAGSVVTAGLGVVRVESIFLESRIARMTEGIKKYSVSESPIQQAINLVIKYCGYGLALVLVLAVIRGFAVHESAIRLVKIVGALSSALMPVGLVFAVTIFFAYGAAHLFRRNVLLQEVNATEKLGRIKNLCMDKTGTLTENTLTVENMFVFSGFDLKMAQELTLAYIQGTGDSSQTLEAIKKSISLKSDREIVDSLAFSSWRRYGAVKIKDGDKATVVYAGPPDVFLPHISNTAEKKWLQDFLNKQAHEGKHVWCTMLSNGTKISPDLQGTDFSIVAVYVFGNNLREGIRHTIDFFQYRGVNIRIISGDDPETTRTVAALAGVKNSDKIITGGEMEAWTAADFDRQASSYAIFARVVPEQKEKIIEALKKDGFTAMVGDGANDALAIKKADLGIAMFDGAPAIRQLASVVLTNNSFSALPGGVRLADSIIRNVEIFAGVFLNLTLAGFLLFAGASLLGYEFPLTPLNITLINYFTVGLPGILISYWTIMSAGKVNSPSNGSFLKKVLPFAVYSAFAQAIFMVAVFLMTPANLRTAESDIFVVLSYITAGFIFFAFTPFVYRGLITRVQQLQIAGLAILETVILFLILRITFLNGFFEVSAVLPKLSLASFSGIIIAFGSLVCFEYWLAGRELAKM